MKKLLNTLYVTTHDTRLSVSNNGVIAENPETGEKVRITGTAIDSIVCFGNTSVTTPLIGYCGESGISLTFLSEYGRFLGRVSGPVSGNVLLRRAQYTQDQKRTEEGFVKPILAGKMRNSREVLMRAARDKADANIADNIALIENCLNRIGDIHGTDALMGLEGIAARAYFDALPFLIGSDEPEMSFSDRNRRPPRDRVNALLSYIYTLCASDAQSALESVGLDPQCGYLHALRPGKPALALDLMEELRAMLCDRFVLSLINLKQIDKNSFEYRDGMFRLTAAARRTVLDAWQKRKQEEIYHSVFKERVEIGMLPYAQAQLLARFVRGDEPAYKAYTWR